ncbi:MAG TPA: hypothetical protein VFW62_13300, partial [bacterium]|nr:hypothetical protein [bacterium]
MRVFCARDRPSVAKPRVAGIHLSPVLGTFRRIVVKLLPKSMFATAMAAALLVAPLGQLLAQNAKPVLVVSISSVEDTLADIAYITKAAGAEDAGRTALLFGNAFTNGIDKKKPIGMYVTPKAGGSDFVGVAFVPVTDLKTILATFKEQIGEPRDAGDGVKELTAPQGQSVYVKEQTGWAFISNEKENLTGLPADPAAMLGNMPKEYTLAAKVSVANIPEGLKKMAVDTIKEGFERQLQANPPGVDSELAEKMQRNQLAALVKMVDELDELMIGFAIDGTGRRTYLDVNVTAREGTSLAKQYAMLADTKSAFAGFLLPGAAATLNLSSTMAKEDIEQTVTLLKGVRQNVLKEIDNDPNLDATKRGAAKEVLGSMMDAFVKTVEGGKLDGGAALLLDAKSVDFVAGGLVAEGKTIEDSFKRLIELAKNEPDFPNVKLNSGSHAGITFHTITAPIPDSEKEARDLLGDKVNIILGIGPKSVYVSFGKNAESLLKQVIDKSAQEGSKSVPPMQLNVALLPILKFAASVDANNPIVPELVKVLEKSGKDKVNIVSQP